MKTITEFSGILLQRAAEAQQAYRATHPQPVTPVIEEVPPPPAATVEGSSAGSEGSSAGSVEASAAGADVVASEQPSAGTAVNDAAGTSEGSAEAATGEQAAEATVAEPALGSGPEAEAVGAALQVQGDRLTRLMEALDVVGRRVAQVRLVRVVQGESAPSGAQKRGEFFYLIDLMPRPQSMQQDSFDSRDGDRRRGPGGRDRGGRPGGNRGPGGAGGGGGAPGSGGKFSLDRPSGRDGGGREARGETPRAGAGWMLGRPQESGHVYAEDRNTQARTDRRPPREPRFDNRGPRPPMGDRPPRGPQPQGAAGAPGARPSPRGEGMGDRPSFGPRPADGGARPGPRQPGNGGRGFGPRRPDGGNGRPDGGNGRGSTEQNWSGRRRGGWDEPAVPELTDAPVTAAMPAAVPSTTAPADNPSAPTTQAAQPTLAETSADSPPENGS